MWFQILPSFAIITAAIGLPGLGLWWAHYLVLGNVDTDTSLSLDIFLLICGYVYFQYFLSYLPVCSIAYFDRQIFNMWYEILPSFFIITAALGLPGWGLYHIHNLSLGNHFRRSLIDRWDRSMYQRDLRLTGNPYNVNGLEQIPDK